MGLTIIRDASEFRAVCERVRAGGGTLGLVPTMGALHDGHLALMREAKKLTSEVAVSIFVNPTQFGPGEDLAKYPRTLEQDRARCQDVGVSLIFMPGEAEMYPPGESTRVRVSGVTDGLCGANRPGHFEGVATIVTKLFVLAGTCKAVFGRKDYQQLKVVERVVQDLLLPVQIIGHPIVREPDGLAMSSRNAYLSPQERLRACAIVQGLSKAWRAYDSGERQVAQLLRLVESEIADKQLRAQYVSLTHPDTLEPFSDSERIAERTLLAVAAHCGNTRLIDNVVLGQDPNPLSGQVKLLG